MKSNDILRTIAASFQPCQEIFRLSPAHHIDDLIGIFDQTFFHSYRTRLIKGDDEPVYLPSDEQCNYHRIVFAHGFYASALHEISHWLIAGHARRQLVDFGYWYCPDGRTAEQQAAFELVEIKPQAIEWALCLACGFDFNVSCDNLSGEQPDRFAFQRKVHAQVARYLDKGFGKRTDMLLKALCHFYQTDYPTSIEQFDFQRELCCE